MRQRELIHNFNKKYRDQFNRSLFKRQDEDIINAIKYIIYSVERQSIFTIKVLNFEVITNYDDVNHILWEYEDSIINKGKSPDKSKKSYGKKKQINQFEYINLNDSELNLIKIVYYIAITEKKRGFVEDTITAYIAVPRIVDDFYFKLNGNIYSAMYQIVDASTYNNSASKNSKKQSITFKSVFTPIRVYRYLLELKDIDGNSVPCNYFVINVFKKSVLLMKYMLAKFGYYNTLHFLHLPLDIFIARECSCIDKEQNYIFPIRDFYIVCPKVIYDNSQIAQSFVYTIHTVLNFMKDAEWCDIYKNDIYIKTLGVDFTTSKGAEDIYYKGLSLLESLEFNYDDLTKADLKLSDEDKADIYRVLRWMVYEFNALRLKDNLDISTKKVRYAEYIASLYAVRLTNGIYRISDQGSNATLDTIKKALLIPPMYLVNAIIKCELVNYKNCVNDLDSIIALKYTFKGIAGIGEKSNAISDAYRSIHPSHLGRVDIDSSSNSDPGVSGTICPYVQLYDSHFSQYEEPSNWRNTVDSLIDSYKAINSKIEICRIINDSDLATKDDSIAKEAGKAAKSILSIADYLNNTEEYINGFDIFGDGLFYYLRED